MKRLSGKTIYRGVDRVKGSARNDEAPRDCQQHGAVTTPQSKGARRGRSYQNEAVGRDSPTGAVAEEEEEEAGMGPCPASLSSRFLLTVSAVGQTQPEDREQGSPGETHSREIGLARHQAERKRADNGSGGSGAALSAHP